MGLARNLSFISTITYPTVMIEFYLVIILFQIILVKMSDSDSDCEMVRVKSFEGHKFAPEDKVFSIKLKPFLGKKKGYIYTLKKNQSLPYAPHLEG